MGDSKYISTTKRRAGITLPRAATLESAVWKKKKNKTKPDTKDREKAACSCACDQPCVQQRELRRMIASVRGPRKTNALRFCFFFFPNCASCISVRASKDLICRHASLQTNKSSLQPRRRWGCTVGDGKGRSQASVQESAPCERREGDGGVRGSLKGLYPSCPVCVCVYRCVSVVF